MNICNLSFQNNSQAVWDQLSDDDAQNYDPKRGFVIKKPKSPLGEYKCAVFSEHEEEKDFLYLHVIASENKGKVYSRVLGIYSYKEYFVTCFI